MPTMASIKYDLKRAMRWRPTPFEIMLTAGVLGFVFVVGTIFWGKLPTTSLARYEASIAALRRTADHFPVRRADLPEGSSFYRAMHYEKLALYTPADTATIDALLERWPMKVEGDASVLETMRPYAERVVPEGTDLEREGAVWGRVIAQPGRGSVWFDRSTGEIVYFSIAREAGR